MLDSQEIAEKFCRHAGLRLRSIRETDAIVIDARLAYRNELHGPFMDPANPEVRLFLNYRHLQGSYSIELLVQDRDDDCFLNSRACGTEKYHGLRATWQAPTAA